MLFFIPISLHSASFLLLHSMANCILSPPQHPWPVGFRFHPTDEELLNHYLKNKMLGNESLVECIPQVDDICKFDPGEPIHSPSNEQEWFFFSASDFEHSIGTGYWESRGKDRKIAAQGTNNLIGTKKTLAFYSGQAPNGTRTNWVMHVYHLHSDTNSTYMDPLVICRLKRKSDENDNVGGTVGEIQEIPGNGQSLFEPGLVDDENCFHEGTPNSSTNDHDSCSLSYECSRVQTPGTMMIKKACRSPLDSKIFKYRCEEYLFTRIPREDRLQKNYMSYPKVITESGHGSVESRVKCSSGILTTKCIHHKSSSPAAAYVARASIGFILFFTVARQVLRYGHWS